MEKKSRTPHEMGALGQRLAEVASGSAGCRFSQRELSAEADRWLLQECHVGEHVNAARDIRASIISGEPPSAEGKAWLERIAEGKAAVAEWARSIRAWW